jgi:hypothetical protein
MVAGNLLRLAVPDDRRFDGRVVGRLHAAPREEFTEVRERRELLDGPSTVDEAAAVVSPRDVVQVDGGPESRHLVFPAGRFNEPEGMDQDSRHVRLAVKRALNG